MATTSNVPNMSNLQVQILRAHVDFIVRSSDAYDDGYQGEVKRFATSMRTLFHDVLPFRSLMAQIEGTQGNFFSMALPRDNDNVSRYGRLIRTARLDGRPIYYAPLDGAWYGAWLTFSEWWNEPIFVDEQRAELSRRDLVVLVADKDAGTNVDPTLSGIYVQLAAHETFGWVEKTPEATSIGAERIAVRQIVHETLMTLLPTYRKFPKQEAEPRLAAAILKANERPASIPMNRGYLRTGPCPCGSGKRFKFCHGVM